MASGRNSPLLARIADWLVWLAFLAETMLLSALVRNRRAYLRGNWMNLIIIIIVGGMLLSRHQLGNTLAVAFITMVLSGVIVSRIDPSIGSVWDGMWCAWVTMSTVGYGDVVPHNAAGRLFGSLLISLLTANLAAMLKKSNRMKKKPTGCSRIYVHGWRVSSANWKSVSLQRTS